MTELKNNVFNNSTIIKETSDLKFSLISKTNLYEIIDNKDNNDMYALIIYPILNFNNKFETIYTLYIIDLNTYKFKNILVSHNNIKAKDVKSFLNKCNIKPNTMIFTLNISPFTTYIVTEYLKKINLKHVFYNKKHYIPIIDYTKLYLHTMTSMTLFNNHLIYDKNINNFTTIWNEQISNIFTKIEENNNIKSNKLYFK